MLVEGRLIGVLGTSLTFVCEIASLRLLTESSMSCNTPFLTGAEFPEAACTAFLTGAEVSVAVCTTFFISWTSFLGLNGILKVGALLLDLKGISSIASLVRIRLAGRFGTPGAETSRFDDPHLSPELDEAPPFLLALKALTLSSTLAS